MKIFIFGYGYVAKFLSRKLIELGWKVDCTSRNISPNNNRKVNLIEFGSQATQMVLDSVDMILSTVPPNEQGIDPVLDKYLNTIISTKNNYKWIGYLSSTGVYGDHQGKWVDEKSICAPNSKRATIRLFVEQQWLNLYHKYNLPIHIFRLSGIYGPGRNCIEKIKDGKNFTIIKAGQYFSRIHIADICQALLASMWKPTAGEIYNISDSEPAPLHQVEQYGAMLLNSPKLSEIPFAQANLSPMARTFFLSNRKVKSQKICDVLEIKWIYPTYKVGLPSLIF